MANDVISIAQKFMNRRKFSSAIKILEGREEIYEDNFEYYLTFGTACLYVGDIGTSTIFYQRARRIKLTDSRLLLGQAAIFLRRGDTDRALQYYLDVKANDPSNKTATEAMEFIRTNGDYDTICRWVDSGKIEKFYPPLGVNDLKVKSIIFSFLLVMMIGFCCVKFIPRSSNIYNGERKDLTQLSLSSSEKSSPQEKDLGVQSFVYLLSDKEITDSYEKALSYFQNHRDNESQREINRILNSNASVSIKQKANILTEYLEVPTFDTLNFNPTVADVESDKLLYQDCWVSWQGRISDAYTNKDGSFECRLLVGYESMKKVDGIIDVIFDSDPAIQTDQPVRILGRISFIEKRLVLQGHSVYQSVHGVLQ
ncbi:MAG: hypothetical protein GX677_09100 [Treponema sp.]|jgi:tetratricopeptide (TPR) repeat protein|nr:hypothetical protein [Treponema sp.]